jgi:uncharacterized protein (DUF2236 family)
MDGYYAKGSLTRRLTKERALLLGGPRALVLQLAHPLVGAGVAEHSGFAADPLSRLRRTLDATMAMVFGTKDEADAAAATINRVHGFVHGVLTEDAGRYAKGTPYDATAPDLLLWVHATLVDTTFTAYTRFVGRLTERELEGAYEESKIAAMLLGTPEDVIPKSYADFRAYFEVMVADELSAAPFQRRVVSDVLYPSLMHLPNAAFWPVVAVTTELLPQRIRDLYELELTSGRHRFSKVVGSAVRGMLPVVPRIVREQPAARRSV